MENIAVHCKTEEEWDKVKSKMGTSRPRWEDSVHGEPANCIGSNGYGWASQGYYNKEGFTIITAAEYLGGKDMKKSGDEKCDNKECEYYNEEEGNHCDEWSPFDLCTYHGGDCEWPHNENKPNIKLKTTKENNMNISDNILEVFTTSKDAKKVANRFGDQYGNTERDLLALRRDKTDLLAIIKDEEDEAKEVKKAAKK